MATLLTKGYVVAVPDYQGLGLGGSYHPYLDATTAGNNMIDAVRVARKLVPDTSTRWLAYGASQGGQASWAANELADSYGSGLNLIGSVSLAPAADVEGLADAAAAGKLTLEQAVVVPWLLWALKKEHPELNLDDYRRGIVEQRWDVFTACDGPLAGERSELAKQITPDDLRPVSTQATDLLRQYLQKMSVPKTRSSAPMLIVFGLEDRLIAAQWTADAVKRACDMGAVAESYAAPGRGHTDIDPLIALAWLGDRFSGSVPVDMCGSLDGPVATLSDKPWYVGGGS
ncbi:lipase family protein [Mycobacterium sp. NPDC006124]|uniref:lipase family protein n=1 Tax=Mycobacterium sp. NPDC006124 TaxID=3156729 RepID=UPI0033A24CE7